MNSPTFPAQVDVLLNQYADETGQEFSASVVDEMYRLTAGHPFLVNRLAAILTEDVATDRTQPISVTNLATARQKLITETNYNFETIRHYASDHKEVVLNILFGTSYEFNLSNEVVSTLYMHGIIGATADGSCQIANPIYADVLLAAFRPILFRLQADTLVNGYDFRPHIAENELQMGTLLSRFRAFVERRGARRSKYSCPDKFCPSRRGIPLWVPVAGRHKALPLHGQNFSGYL